MQVIPVTDSHRCELVPYEAISQLTAPALGLLVYLLRFGESHQGAIADLATRKSLGLTKAKVEAAARELRHQGFMRVDRTQVRGKLAAVTYVSGRPNPEWAEAERTWSETQRAKLSGPRKVVW